MIRQKLGVCYYPEHWPEWRWAEDAARMKEIGLSVVRIGEFAWSRLEPAPGAYDFDWLRRAIDTLHAAGLEVVLGTPTATPPKWLVDQMPDMLARDAEGRPRNFGSRRHYCFSHAGYADECARIVTRLAETFGEHPGVAAWQTDNEYGCHDTVESFSEDARNAFREWCREKYGAIGAQNDAWGNVFWSMELSSFEQIELPNLTVTEANPAYLLDFQRFSSDQVVAFNRRQTEILRRLSPGRPILHNFMGAFTAFDHFALSRDLDAAAWDSYPLGFLERSAGDDAFKQRYMRVGDPDFQAFHHDLYRGCGRGRWWVMEQQPGPVNWAPWNPAPADGAVRMWTYEAFAAGAETVSYFRWRQAPFGQEQMHEALLLPNSEPADAFHVAAGIARELAAIGAHVATKRADVLLVFDYESDWAWRIQPQGRSFSYWELAMRFYRGLRRKGLSIDIGPPTAEAVEGRKLILLPGLFAASPGLIDALSRSAATVLLGPRAGSRTPDFQIPADLPPGLMRRLIDVKVRRVESLRPTTDIAMENADGRFERWREFLVLGDHAEAVLSSRDAAPALARQGACYYLAGWPDDALLDGVLSRLLSEAGVSALAPPEDVRVRDNGALRYFFNYGDTPVDVSALVGSARLVLGERLLAPCGVAACEITQTKAENDRHKRRS